MGSPQRTYLDWSSKQFRLHALAEREAGKLLVVCNGCFDLLHPGHVSLLTWAAEHFTFGGCRQVCLIAAVNSDRSVRGLKGKDRPYLPLADRLYMLSSLRAVNIAVGFDEPTPEELIAYIKPNNLVKGAEYEGRDIPGAQYTHVTFAPQQACYSTTAMVELIRTSKK